MDSSFLPGNTAGDCPRLFSVLGGAVTRASLQQAQRDVDTLIDVSRSSEVGASLRPSATAQTSAASASASPTQSLRRVLDALRAVQASTRSADASANERDVDTDKAPLAAASSVSSSEPNSSLSSAPDVRDTLIQHLGVAAGSALYRECVVAPRRRLHRLVRRLAQCVRTTYLPLLAQHTATLSVTDAVDVHVQLYPSPLHYAVAAVPAPLRDGGFVAAVTVRRLSALEAQAEAGRRLRDRFLSVSAPGQTLASALAFWADVSYGDVPPAALAAYPPLGFDEAEEGEATLVKASMLHRMREGDDGDQQRGAKAARTATAEMARAPVLLGLPAHHERQPVTVTAAGEQPRWVQPECWSVSTPVAEGRGAARAAVAAASYPSAGLLAVLYVHCSGVAYVGYPLPTKAATATRDGVGDGGVAADGATVAAVADETAASLTCTVPMLSSTGFVRSLLGLS